MEKPIPENEFPAEPEVIEGKEAVAIGEERFGFAREFDEIKNLEREKTPKEIELISLANDLTNELFSSLNLEPSEVSEEDVSVIERDIWNEKWGEHCSGELAVKRLPDNTLQKKIACVERPSSMVFCETLVHEVLHLKSLKPVTKELADLDIIAFKVGIAEVGREGQVHEQLNEAITEEITRRLVDKSFKENTIFEEERRQTEIIKSSLAKSADPQLRDGEGGVFSNDDMFYMGETSQLPKWGIDNKVVDEPGSTGVFGVSYRYPQERKMLNGLMDKIFEKNPSQWANDKNKVFEVFAKGMLTGDLGAMREAVDGAFGSMTLYDLIRTGKDVKQQLEFVSAL